MPECRTCLFLIPGRARVRCGTREAPRAALPLLPACERYERADDALNANWNAPAPDPWPWIYPSGAQESESAEGGHGEGETAAGDLGAFAGALDRGPQ